MNILSVWRICVPNAIPQIHVDTPFHGTQQFIKFVQSWTSNPGKQYVKKSIIITRTLYFAVTNYLEFSYTITFKTLAKLLYYKRH